MRSRRGPTADDARCVAPADLTAFVLGELDADARAAIARHLLACAACRARRETEGSVVARLQAFAALAPWEEDLAAADLARRAGARARLRGALAGAAAAAVLATAIAGGPSWRRTDAPAPARDVAASPGALTSPASAAGAARTHHALLAAQAADGRWQATTGVDRHDVGATGLALLALVRDPTSLDAGPVARAIADGVRWLAPRAGDARVATDRDRAIAASALAAVFARTGDRTVGQAADRARRSVAAGASTVGVPDPAEALAYVRTAPRAVASLR